MSHPPRPDNGNLDRGPTGMLSGGTMADEAKKEQDPVADVRVDDLEGITPGEAASAMLDMFAEDPDFAEATEVDDEDDGEEDFDDDDFDDFDDNLDDEDPEDDEDDDDEEDPEDDDADDDAEDETDDPDTQTYTVTVDGEEETVTLDEALAGYMRQRAFTKKTTEVADTKAALREKEQDLLGLEQQYVQNLELVETLIRGGLPEEPNWAEIKSKYPDTYSQIRDNWDDRQSQLKQIRGERERAIEAAQERLAQAREAKIADEQEKLLAKVPEWLDKDVQREDTAKLVKAAGEYGVTPDELSNVLDHRFILILRDAMRARQQDATADTAEKVKRRTRRKSKSLRSGTRTTTSKKRGKKASKRGRAARKRLATSGRVDDAALAILDHIDL